jgi:hypothetical protein
MKYISYTGMKLFIVFEEAVGEWEEVTQSSVIETSVFHRGSRCPR